MVQEFYRMLSEALPEHSHSIRGRDFMMWSTGATKTGRQPYEIIKVDTRLPDAMERLRCKVKSIQRQLAG